MGQQLGRLRRGELQVGGADLGQVTGGTHPVQREYRVGARDEHQPQLLGLAAQQHRQVLHDPRLVDLVEVVEYQRHLLRQPGEAAGHPADECLVHRGPGADLAKVAHVLDGTGVAQRGQHVRPEDGGIVVIVVKGEPADRLLPCRGSRPGRDEQGLAPAGSRADQGDRTFVARVEQLDQPRARHERRRYPRPGQVRRNRAGGPRGRSPRPHAQCPTGWTGRARTAAQDARDAVVDHVTPCFPRCRTRPAITTGAAPPSAGFASGHAPPAVFHARDSGKRQGPGRFPLLRLPIPAHIRGRRITRNV